MTRDAVVSRFGELGFSDNISKTEDVKGRNRYLPWSGCFGKVSFNPSRRNLAML